MNILLFSPSREIFYYCGYEGIGALLVAGKKKYLFAPEMEFPKIKGVTVIRTKDLLQAVSEKIKKLGLKKLNIEITIPRILYRKLKTRLKIKFCDFQSERTLKTKKEILKIKKACNLTDKIFKKLLINFSFKTELQIKNFIVNEIRKTGCMPAFEPIVASGKNASKPHYNGNSRLKRGFLVIDFGVKYKGYCSDMSRTIYLGKPMKKEKELYGKVVIELTKLTKQVRPGLKCASLANLYKLKNFMPHSLGHGIGLEPHESPAISQKSKDKFSKGMCFTLEPSVYGKDYGIRIEDVIYLDKKALVLTKSTKRLINMTSI